jgi:hypothetical protein
MEGHVGCIPGPEGRPFHFAPPFPAPGGKDGEKSESAI